MIIRTVPPHIRKGLLRLYVAVAVPWAVWYGVQVQDAIDRHRGQRYVSEAFRSLLIVPIGAPILFVIVVWVVAGFQKSARTSDPAAPNATPPEPDYHLIIARAVADLADNTSEARQAIYERARSVLVSQLRQQGTPELQIIIEQDELEAAIRKVEGGLPPSSFAQD